MIPLRPLGGGGPAPREGPAELFDWTLGRQLVTFALHSLRRHTLLASVAFAAAAGLALAAAWALPRAYKAEVRILTARNQVMPALGNPGRMVPRESDAPTQAASELVLRRDNLVALAKQTGLLDQWAQGRAPVVVLKDALVALVEGPPSEEDRLEALVALLEKRLVVTTREGTVSLAISWPDAQMAYQLVEAAQRNFIETRHAMEVSTITEAISILEWHSSGMRNSLQATLEELRKARDAARLAAPVPAPGAVAVRGAPTARRAGEARRAGSDQELLQAQAMLTAKQRALDDLEEHRRKRLAELQSQLAEQTATYAPAHPLVVTTRDSIAALSRDSPQIESLRRETEELAREIAARAARPVAAEPAQAPSAEPLLEARRELASPGREPGSSKDDDVSVEFLKDQLKIASDKYEDLQSRIEGARIELDTARAAFKYRYSVIEPARVPKEAEPPRPAAVVAGGLLGALLLSLFAAVAADLRPRRIVEAWQVERALGLRVLAQVRRA